MVRERDLTEAAVQADDLPDLRDIVGKHEGIPIRDLFNPFFIQEYTDSESFDKMVAVGPSDVDSADELDLVPDGTWDEFVAGTTFENEAEMVLAVRDEWVAAQLGL